MKIDGGVVQFAATDLAHHLGCAHRSTLAYEQAMGRPRGKTAYDPVLDILAERGRAHEAAYAEHLTATGRTVSIATDLAGTKALIESGADVIAQAHLERDNWNGRADFLVRIDSPVVHAWSYEIHEAKLAVETRAEAVLQLCVYADLMSSVLGHEPELLVIVRPGRAPGTFETERFRFAEYAAIYRLLRQDLETHAAKRTSPEPCAACETCMWYPTCDREWRDADHLTLVAGSGRSQRRELMTRDISTLSRLAVEPRPIQWKPTRGSAATYEGLGHQAALQLESRSTEIPSVEVLPPLPERGLARLPVPSSRDVFLDFEGDPFIGSGGREFLFGWASREGGDLVYRGTWATDDGAERAAFVALVHAMKERLDADPGMHVYHFAPYEPAALKRLMGRHAIGDAVVDELLRRRRFIDLMTITRQALRIGVESYGLKSLEAVTGYKRLIELSVAGGSLRHTRLLLQRGEGSSVLPAWRSDVERYNEDDCRSAAALRDYLEGVREQAISEGAPIARPPLREDEPPEDKDGVRGAVAEVVGQLMASVSAAAPERSPDEHGRALLAGLVGYYAREQKPEQWDFFRLAELDEDERLEDPGALAGMTLVERVDPGGKTGGRGRARAPVDRYRFPPQELKLAPDDALCIDTETRLGTVVVVDPDEGLIDVRKSGSATDEHPSSCFVRTGVSTKVKEEALLRVARDVVASGFRPSVERSLARDILLREPPRGLRSDRSLRADDETAVAAARRLALVMDGSILPIQGPPGTGKTETAACMILALVQAGRKVGVTATGYAVICNLLQRVIELGNKVGQRVRVALRVSGDGKAPDGIPTILKATDADAAMPSLDVLGATAWHWARADVFPVDVLVVDEAGQVSLADAVAVSSAARNMVLVGDPQQLDQPTRAAHPDGVAVSVLEHMLEGAATVLPSRGLLLDRTYRLTPSICAYTAEQFYGGRLQSEPGVERRRLHVPGLPALASNGLFFAPVDHHGNQSRAPEEARAVAALVAAIRRSTPEFMDLDGDACPLGDEQILVVAPFNAHVSAIRGALRSMGHPDVRVGTVDKFQGQEAPIAIYAMATSHPDDAPRGIEFLYSRNRLNVATSRAQCAAILVANPALLRPNCSTPAHLRLASALCRFVELARTLEIPGVAS